MISSCSILRIMNLEHLVKTEKMNLFKNFEEIIELKIDQRFNQSTFNIPK